MNQYYQKWLNKWEFLVADFECFYSPYLGSNQTSKNFSRAISSVDDIVWMDFKEYNEPGFLIVETIHFFSYIITHHILIS